MPQPNLPRNMYMYNNSGQTPVISAGLMQLGYITTAEFYACLEICFKQSTASECQLCDATETVLDPASGGTVFPPGNYYIISLGIQ